MGNKYVNNPHDFVEKRFSRVEVQVTYIIHNVNLLMVALKNKLRLFGEDGTHRYDKRED